MNAIRSLLRLLKVPPTANGELAVRAMLLIYLMDWKATLDLGTPITSTRWKPRRGVPYTSDVVKALVESREVPDDGSAVSGLTPEQMRVVLEVAKRWSGASTFDLMRFARSTFPMFAASDAREVFDLRSLATQYRRDFKRKAVTA
jgi:hypothetical protein